MSKKLIAVASAAAIALSALVATPASANVFTVEVIGISDQSTTAKVKTTPATNAAPVNNELEHKEEASTTNTTVRFVVTTTLANTDVAVTSAGGVLVLDDLDDADGDPLPVGSGSTGLNGKSIAGAKTFTFYAYSTKTTAGTVSITSGGNTQLFYVRSLVGEVYNIASAEFPTSIVTDKVSPVYVKLTDVFGNAITGSAIGSNFGDQVVNAAGTGVAAAFDKSSYATAPTAANDKLYISAVGGTVQGYVTATTGNEAVAAWVWVAEKSAWAVQVKASDIAGSIAIRLDLADNERADSGFAKGAISKFSNASGADLAAQVASLNSQVAALTAQVAARVSKKRFNKLARKWNAAFPGQKVALKK